MATKTTKKTTAPKSNLPAGFTALRSQMAGFYVCEEGNAVQGVIKGSFIVAARNGFPAKRVYRVTLTAGETKIMAKDIGETVAGEGEMIGVDEKGYLKMLNDIPEGTEIAFVCVGKEPAARVKAGRQPAWMFDVGTVRGREPGSDDDVIS